MPGDAVEVEVGGRRVRLTHLDRRLYRDGTTKADVVRYAVEVADALLPHLRGRPLTVRRWPDGTDGAPFFMKRLPQGAPAWLETAEVPSDEADLRQPLVAEVADLVWLANIAALELHVPLWRAPAWERPTHVVLDLDPGPPAGLLACCEVALVVRDVLDAAGLRAGAKVSGGKGLHVLVPTGGSATAAQTRAFARAVAEVVAAQHPTRVVATIGKAERAGKVLVDWNQNDVKRTMIAPWSLRGSAPSPRVALPVAWEEIEAAVAARTSVALEVGPDAALARLAERGDPLAVLGEPSQVLPGT